MEHYSGADKYSDGSIEDWLLETVKKYGDIDYSDIIAQNPVWAVLYHLSSVRENIISWYPFTKNDSVLEIGSGCGAVTGALIKTCGKVKSLDLSLRRSQINAFRHRDAENLEIIVANFEEACSTIQDTYSYITLIGVLEYAPLYIHGENPFIQMLQKMDSLLDKNGKILIAIENRLGLKYFAGCNEDHLGISFRNIEGYHKEDSVKTFSKKELTDLCNQAGYNQVKFFYPYPDYKLPDRIYSDDYLPKCGDLRRNLNNFDSDRLLLFDESQAFDSIINAGLFSEFSNSFFVEIGRG